MQAGHKASTSRIIAQVTTTIESPQVNLAVLKQMAENLREKQATIMKLDAELLEVMTEEDEVKEEIEQADIYRKRVESAIIDLESEICAIERNEPNKVSLVEDRPTTRSAIPPQNPTAQTAVLPSVTVKPALDARRAPRVRLPRVELKRFDGRLTDWTMFWDMFQSSVHNNAEHTDTDRFYYLHSLLEGSAANAISGNSLTTAKMEPLTCDDKVNARSMKWLIEAQWPHISISRSSVKRARTGNGLDSIESKILSNDTKRKL
ncbi:hypothetical protein EMCRGX_G016708 [Ephydatia muelleri]